VSTSGKIIGACLGLTAFAVATVAGIFAGAPASVVLFRAMVAMLVCAGVGQILGLVATRAVREYVEAYVSDHPVPRSPEETVASDTDEDVDTRGEARAA